MPRKLYVGGLNAATDSAGLREAFQEHGEITEATVITDRESGSSRGFGFVTFADDASAAAAIQARNGSDLHGATISVAEARERPGGHRTGFGRRDGRPT